MLCSLQRAKRPILRFKAHEGLLTSPIGEQAKQRYLIFARASDAYITKLYADWEQVKRAVYHQSNTRQLGVCHPA